MSDLTTQFRSFRECARVSWNAFIRCSPDGELNFGPVESALFDAMLRPHLLHYEAEKSLCGRDYFPGLRVVPTSPEFTFLAAYEEEDHWRWTEEKWHAKSVTLNYVGLFDFDTLEGSYREFRFVEALVVAEIGMSGRIGQRVLIEADRCLLYDGSPDPSAAE